MTTQEILMRYLIMFGMDGYVSLSKFFCVHLGWKLFHFVWDTLSTTIICLSTINTSINFFLLLNNTLSLS